MNIYIYTYKYSIAHFPWWSTHFQLHLFVRYQLTQCPNTLHKIKRSHRKSSLCLIMFPFIYQFMGDVPFKIHHIAIVHKSQFFSGKSPILIGFVQPCLMYQTPGWQSTQTTVFTAARRGLPRIYLGDWWWGLWTNSWEIYQATVLLVGDVVVMGIY